MSAVKIINYINGSEFNTLTDTVLVSEEFIEDGTGKKISTTVYERNPKARKECIRIHGTKCYICGFDAKEVYGDEYEGKIHIHHKNAIHQIGKEYVVDPDKDLVPICPNCHMIIHIKINGEELTVEQLKEKYISLRNK